MSVDLLAMTNVVVSVHGRKIEGLGVPIDVVKGETQFGALDESAFVAVLLDGILAGYFRAVEGIEQRIDEYDTRALQARLDDDLIGDLVGLRREWPCCAVRSVHSARSSTRSSVRAWSWAIRKCSLAAAGRPVSPGDRSGRERSRVAGRHFDIVISRQGERTNDVMRVLTVISSVLLPSVVIAGVMGMNFKPRLLRRSAELLHRDRRDGLARDRDPAGRPAEALGLERQRSSISQA